MLTSRFTRYKGWVKSVDGQIAPDHIKKLRIPPAWTDVKVDPDPNAVRLAIGKDEAGRNQILYSAAHVAQSKSNKFERVRALLAEWSDIRTQIESELNRKGEEKTKESALIAMLIYDTGIRPGSTADTLAQVQAYGATTLQLRHVKPCARGVRLQFVGKKGVKQNILVTNPYLVRVFMKRKRATSAWTTPLFEVSAGLLRQYFKTLGSGIFTPKDFRTGVGTSLALELLGNRKRLPRTKSGRKQLINNALDKVAAKLGNTRSVSRSSYVDPAIFERILPQG